MADFSHLKTLDVTEESEAEYIFEDIPGEPSIWFRPMTDSNPDFMNERVRLAVERAEKDQAKTKAKRRKQVLSTDRLEEDRDFDRILMARTCVIRWGKPFADVDGKVHDLNEQTALDFFNALPNYMLDPCRGWLSNPYNFVNPDAVEAMKKKLTPDQADDLGNSSPKG